MPWEKNCETMYDNRIIDSFFFFFLLIKLFTLIEIATRNEIEIYNMSYQFLHKIILYAIVSNIINIVIQ